MKRLWVGLSLLLVCVTVTAAARYRDQVDQPACSYCGMDRTKFAHSRMLVKYEDGGEVGTCSLHCMALEFANAIDRVPAQLLVADYASGQLIAADEAVWVLGGDRAGVMTMRAKWAFARKTAAEDFISRYGGSLIDFEQALKAAYEDMYRDTQRLRKMRAMKKTNIQDMKRHQHD